MVVCNGWVGRWTLRWTTPFQDWRKPDGASSLKNRHPPHLLLEHTGAPRATAPPCAGAASPPRAGAASPRRLGRQHLLKRGRGHLLGLGRQGRRHLLPPPLPWWLAWRHALAWGRRSSWIHFLVTGDGCSRVFLVSWLTKFLAGQDLYW
jgi:hypothetical protein